MPKKKLIWETTNNSNEHMTKYNNDKKNTHCFFFVLADSLLFDVLGRLLGETPLSSEFEFPLTSLAPDRLPLEL